jgi:putative transposase
MRDNNLLHPKIARRTPSGKNFIDFTVPPLEGPFRTVEVDIKYIYIHGEKKNAYLVSFICTFCRCNPIWELNYTMTSAQVVALLNAFLNHPIVRRYLKNNNLIIKIRTDNGPQFIAKLLAEAIKKEGLEHEFIRPGTPQQNGHIEAFHSTVTRLLCNRNIFEDLNHANEVFKEFFLAYNKTRVMKSLLHYSPVQFLNVWESGNVGIKRDKNGREIFYFREKPAPLKETDPPAEDFLGLNKYITFDNRVLTTKKNSPVL